MKRAALLLLISSLILSGCGQKKPVNNQFENEINAFCDRIVEIDSSINKISNKTGDEAGLEVAKEELLNCLSSLKDEFKKFANMDFPQEYDYLEQMADEAGDYMTEAVNTYDSMYGTDNGYNVNLEEYADENYARAYKRVRIITALLRGETPDEEGLIIQ